MLVSMYRACGIFTALVNNDNPILLDLLEGLLGVKFLCVVSTVIWISWIVRIFLCKPQGTSSLDQATASEKTSDVAESSGWLVLGVAPQLVNRRTCRCTENVLNLRCLLDL